MGPRVRRGQDSLIRFIVFAFQLTLGRGAHIPRKRSKAEKNIKKERRTHHGKSRWKAVFRASMMQTTSARAARTGRAQSYFKREKNVDIKILISRECLRRKLVGSTSRTFHRIVGGYFDWIYTDTSFLQRYSWFNHAPTFVFDSIWVRWWEIAKVFSRAMWNRASGFPHRDTSLWSPSPFSACKKSTSRG